MGIFDVKINNTEITLPTDRYVAEQHLCELELDLPSAEYSMQLLDRAKIGARYREEVGGEFIANGFLMAGEIDFDATPLEEPLPWLDIEIDEERNQAYTHSLLPQLHGYIVRMDDVAGLRNFAATLEAMSDDDMLKFRILAEQAKGFYEVTQLVDTLHHYDVDSTFELMDFAWRMLIDEYGFSEDDPLLEHVDLTGFGNEIAKEAGYTLSRYGAVLANDDGMQYGNWAIRTGFIYGNLAFVQQVNGGDEWLALRQTAPDEWNSFDSISLGHVLQEYGAEGFETYVQTLVEPQQTQSFGEITMQ
ncbi:MAG: hypothetical protein FWE40_09320 [Oscillospiraceae bacterium]|nr:hypothetical protein [Oscillospiraceae bacterium]